MATCTGRTAAGAMQSLASAARVGATAINNIQNSAVSCNAGLTLDVMYRAGLTLAVIYMAITELDVIYMAVTTLDVMYSRTNTGCNL